MKQLLTVNDYILYIDSLKTSENLRYRFKNRYDVYQINDITVISPSADFDIMWKLCLEYLDFINTPIHIDMFMGDKAIFIGLICTEVEENLHVDRYYTIKDTLVFTQVSDKIQSRFLKLIDILHLDIKLKDSLYSQAGVIIDISHFNSTTNEKNI